MLNSAEFVLKLRLDTFVADSISYKISLERTKVVENNIILRDRSFRRNFDIETVNLPYRNSYGTVKAAVR